MRALLLGAALTLAAPAMASEAERIEELERRVEALEAGSTPAGRRGYEAYCAPCHGDSGRGDGPGGRDLFGPPPTDFTRGKYQYRGTLGRASEDDLLRTVMRGMPGTEMPAYRGLLSEAEGRAIVRVVLGFSPRNGEEPPGEPLEVPPPPSDGPDAAARAAEVYEKRCMACHGAEGRGDGPGAAFLVEPDGTLHVPRDLTRGIFEGGGAPEDLYRTLATGMEGTPMPAYHTLISPDEIWLAVHHLRTLEKRRSGWWRFLHDNPVDPAAPGSGGRKEEVR